MESKFEQFAKTYKNFHVPFFKISVAGQDLVRMGIGVSKVSVDTSASASDHFSFTVVNTFDLVGREFEWINEYLSIGESVKILMGYTDRLKTMFTGLITKVNFHFSQEGNPTFDVEGMDIGFKMQRGKKSRPPWKKKKDSEVVKIIASEYGLRSNIVDTVVVHNKIAHNRVDDYKFIKDMADKGGYEFFITGNTLYFRRT